MVSNVFTNRFAKSIVPGRRSRFRNSNGNGLILALAIALVLLPGVSPVLGQNQSSPPPQDNTQNNGKPKQEVPAEAGGPPGDSPYAIPKKNPAEAPPPPPPITPAKTEGMPDYSIKVNVPLVNVDVMVTLKSNGQWVQGLKKDNFRVFEDGSQQQITNFNGVKLGDVI